MKRFLYVLILIAVITSLSSKSPVKAAGAITNPILLITNGGNGSYLAEILRAEGINAFDTLNLSAVAGASTLTPYDLVILGSGALTPVQASTISTYVSGGGHLIAIRPDSRLYSVVGLSNSGGGALTTPYMKINDTASFPTLQQQPGFGLSTESLQLHTPADQFPLAAGAVMLAELYTNPLTASTFPAVSANVSGSGLAVAFTYDLPKNIILTRQGNPANVNTDVDGDGVVRTTDLFQTAGGGAPWIDHNLIPVPQADIQQRLFARLVRQLVNMPLPQLWYFPGNAKTMLVLTSDVHGQNDSVFQNVMDMIGSHGGKTTFYLSMTADPIDSLVNTWRSLGYGFGIHPYAILPDNSPPISNLSDGYSVADTWWNFQHASAPYSRTVRNHQLAWVGWTDAVGYESSHHIALDANNYPYGHWLNDGTTWEHGYMNGSGLPMKFAQLDGTVLDVFQQTTLLVDEQLFDASVNGIFLYDCFLNPQQYECGDQAMTITHNLIDASQSGYYSAVMAQFHLDYFNYGEINPWIEDTLHYAISNSIPIWSADQWLDFTEKRYAATFSNLTWNNTLGNLTFDISPTADLTAMLPVSYLGQSLVNVKMDGSPTPIPTNAVNINGVNLAFFKAASGAHTYTAQYNRSGLADLSVISGSSATTVNAGETFTYIWTVHNSGPDAAAGVQLTDTLSGNLTLVSAIPSMGSCGTVNPVVCNLGTLPNGGNATVTIVAGVNPLARGSLTNSACVTSSTSDLNVGNNSASKTVTVTETVDLKVSLAANVSRLTLGGPIRYTVNVSNLGSSTAPSVLVVVPMPAGAVYVNAVGTGGWVCGLSNGAATCALPQLAKGSAQSILIDILAPVSGSRVTAVATVSFAGTDQNLSDNTATIQIPLIRDFFLPSILKN